MKKAGFITMLLFMTAAAQPVAAQTYNFNVLYFGSGVATLVPGSYNPVGQNVQPTESFLWTIQAQNGGFWDVVTGGDFFPLMAFTMQESGTRDGTFALRLLRSGAPVFTFSETSGQSCAHMGTNTISLGTGLQFDRMELDYLLNSAAEAGGCGGILGTPLATNTIGTNGTQSGLLPIFGAPEESSFSPGIAYNVSAVPEPATLAMTLLGLGIVGGMARRRSRNAKSA